MAKGGVWRLTTAPAFKHKVRGGKSALAIFEDCHKCWRAGLVSDFYHGTRSDDDPTIVWQLDGLEIDAVDLTAELARRRDAAGIESIEWGPYWVGFRAVVVTFADGRVVTERYNGREVETEVAS